MSRRTGVRKSPVAGGLPRRKVVEAKVETFKCAGCGMIKNRKPGPGRRPTYCSTTCRVRKWKERNGG